MAGIDFLVGLATDIASKLVCGAIREGSYCCCFNNFVEDLKKEKQQLVEYKKVWDERVRKAKQETKKIDSVVELWLEVAESLKKEVESLEEKAEKNKNCCTGCYPNWVYRYILSKQLSKKKETIKQHCEESHNLRELTRLASFPGIRYYSSEDFMDFASRKLARQQLVEALKDDEVSMIGLYGMGGCGKTTLAKEIGKEAEQFFKKVVFVVVSNNATVRGIQDKIASSLQLELEKSEEKERAQRLCMSLNSGNEKMLMILDDVWEKLDFEAIGIPFREKGKSCKVLITTRSLSICKAMNCQKEISLSILSFKESWDLFQKHAHITDESSNALKDFAKEITKKCDGLPVAIAAIASTLKGKTLDEWEVASKSLKHSKPVDIEQGLQNPYTCLKLSYNSLKSKEAKSLFLLCSAFPEDCAIDVELLTRCAIGLGLFGRDSSNTMGRKEVNVAKNKLINSCLLLEVDKEEEEEEEECVKMHDLVRDAALWIANKENKVILGPEKFENVMEKDMSIKDSRISYMSCNKLPKQLDCSKLEYLHAYIDSEQVEIPCEYFKGTKKVRVLVLTSTGFHLRIRVPLNVNSIQTLTCLRCLVFIDWELGDISIIGCLKALESLTLRSCSIQKLPEAVELKLLEVSCCAIKMNPYEVIGKYSYLEELCFFGNYGSEWKFDDENAAELLEKFSAPQQLQRYNVKLGATKTDFSMVCGSVSRILAVQYVDASTKSATVLDLVGKAE